MTDHLDFRMLAAEAIDGPLGAANAATLEAHLATCPSCRAEVRLLQADAARLRSISPVPAPGWIRDELVTEIGRYERRKSRPMVHTASQLRFSNGLAVLALLVALILVVLALLVGNQRPKLIAVVTPPPSPTASASGEPPDAGAPIPAALRARWVRAPKDISGVQNLAQGISLRVDLTDSELWFSNVKDTRQFDSNASVDAAGSIRLVSAADWSGCKAGTVGLYAVEQSTGGNRLKTHLINDECATRGRALAGELFRVGCKRPQDCLGDLDAGTYPTQYFLGSWGALEYTVPAGWANSSDGGGSGGASVFSLTPSPDFALEDASGPAAANAHELDIFAWPRPLVQNDACTNQLAPSGEQATIDSLTAHLRKSPGIVAKKQKTMSIDGHRSIWLDISMAGDWAARCPGAPGGGPMVVIAGPPAGAGAFDGQRDWMTIQGAERQRLILIEGPFVNAPPEQYMVISIRSSDPTRFDSLVKESMPIVETFKFAQPVPPDMLETICPSCGA